MAERSKISWTDHSFAPWHGCTKVSTGDRGACEHCYAENLDVHRFHKVPGFGPGIPRVRSPQSTWDQVRAWDRAAKRAGVRRTVFCSHLSDLFDKEVDPTWRADAFLLMHETPNLIYLVLTKRPPNIEKFAPSHFPPNAALGFTAVTQPEFDRDVVTVLKAKEKLRPLFTFVSIGPAMGLVDPSRACRRMDLGKEVALDALTGEKLVGKPMLARGFHRVPHFASGGLDWVITEGESDQGKGKARPSHHDWFRVPRDRCAEAGKPYHHKQNGEYHPWTGREPRTPPSKHVWLRPDGEGTQDPAVAERWDREAGGPASQLMVKIGKKAAGRLLDGQLHDARPEVAHA